MSYKVLISGGGTGGHVFPAISIANEIKTRCSDAEILFIGANGKLEMEKVPNAGYKIIGLPIIGLPRKISIKFFRFVINYFKSQKQAVKILKNFNPNFVIGVGGFASFPALSAAKKLKIPYFIQEQNSFPGKVNIKLAPKAKKIFVAYTTLEKYFPKEKIIITGNPIRKDILNFTPKNEEAYKYFKLEKNKKTILILGGSLGSRTINESIMQNINLFCNNDIQVIWQTGKYYAEEMKKRYEKFVNENQNQKHKILQMPFIEKMNFAYSVADLIISRAGASSISELTVVGCPVIFVPSPNVAEDHQRKNAMALVEKNAAVMIPDNEAIEKLVPKSIELIQDEKKSNELAKNIKALALINSTKNIIDEILKLF